jgi:disulfide bond formation protein DsbB
MVVLGQYRLLQREGVGAVMFVAMVVVVLRPAVMLGLTVVGVVAMVEAMLLIVITGMDAGQQANPRLLRPAPTRCTHS